MILLNSMFRMITNYHFYFLRVITVINIFVILQLIERLEIYDNKKIIKISFFHRKLNQLFFFYHFAVYFITYFFYFCLIVLYKPVDYECVQLFGTL